MSEIYSNIDTSKCSFSDGKISCKQEGRCLLFNPKDDEQRPQNEVIRLLLVRKFLNQLTGCSLERLLILAGNINPREILPSGTEDANPTIVLEDSDTENS